MKVPVREIAYGQELQDGITKGVAKIYEVAKAAYGPKAGNALIELSAGSPLLSRDGVTNVSKVRLEDPIEDMAAQVVKQASKQSNERAGDGTSAAVILSYHLYSEAVKLVAAGHNRMEVSQKIEEAARKAIAHIDNLKKPVNEDLLISVASISASNEAIGQLIAEVINKVGADGGITVEDMPGGIGITEEVVDGFYFKRGFSDVRLINDYTNLRASYTNVPLLICDNRMSTLAEIAPIIEKLIPAGIKQLVIVGEVVDDALSTLILSKKILDCTVVNPPVFGGGRTLFLEDLAILTGGKIMESKPDDFSIDDLGMAANVTITESSTTIIGGDGSQEDKEKRIADLRDQLEENSNPQSVEAIKGRLSRLTGKVAVIRVGGATEIEQQETKLRVQDAVCAVQAALADGIVPGGGVALATVKDTGFDGAFKQPFRQLLENGGFNPDMFLARLKDSKEWTGFNIRKITDESQPTDMLKEGIIDPSKVVKEVVNNAASVASRLITTSVAITFKERE